MMPWSKLGDILQVYIKGYPLKAGHSVASITYPREDLMALTRPWYIVDLR
jgi:hypothetical protein